MTLIRVALLCFTLAFSGLLFGQKPAKSSKQRPASSLTQSKSKIDTSGLAREMRAFQVFSNKVNALAKKKDKSDKTVEQVVNLAQELAAKHPGGRFPSHLLDAKGTPLSLKAQKEVYYNLFPSMEEARSLAKESGQPEYAPGLSQRQINCFNEYYTYTHHSTPISQIFPQIVILMEIPLHQSKMKNMFGHIGECSESDIWLHLPIHVFANSY